MSYYTDGEDNSGDSTAHDNKKANHIGIFVGVTLLGSTVVIVVITLLLLILVFYFKRKTRLQ